MRGCRSRPLAVLQVESRDASRSKRILQEVSSVLQSVAAYSLSMIPALLAEVIRSVLEKNYDAVGIVGDGRLSLIEAP